MVSGAPFDQHRVLYCGVHLLGILAGLRLDNRLNTAPRSILLGLFLGLALAGFGFYRMVRPLMDRQDKGKGR